LNINNLLVNARQTDSDVGQNSVRVRMLDASPVNFMLLYRPGVLNRITVTDENVGSNPAWSALLDLIGAASLTRLLLATGALGKQV